MLIHPPTKSNAQRQREFCRRNPGYYARLQARRRAADMAVSMVAAQTAAPPVKTQLLLPAPVETIEIPGMTTIRSIRQSEAGLAVTFDSL